MTDTEYLQWLLQQQMNEMELKQILGEINDSTY